jgi:hypothetical protein
MKNQSCSESFNSSLSDTSLSIVPSHDDNHCQIIFIPKTEQEYKAYSYAVTRVLSRWGFRPFLKQGSDGFDEVEPNIWEISSEKEGISDKIAQIVPEIRALAFAILGGV